VFEESPINGTANAKEYLHHKLACPPLEPAMSNTVTCPSCHAAIEVTEVMSAQLAARIRAELEREVAMQRNAVEQRAQELTDLQAMLEAKNEDLEQQINVRLRQERDKLVADARQKATEELAVQLTDRDEQLRELHANLLVSQKNELEIRKRERELITKSEQLELDVARQMDLERCKIRDEALKQADEQHRLKAAEKEEQINGLLQKIDELKRKAEQGSQQIQGEVLEMDIENLLREMFSHDTIDEVPKGKCGGDILQQVRTPHGRSSGTILWESKRTKNWQPSWLPKLRDDQRAAGAECAILISETLPEGVTTFAQIEGIWVCHRRYVVPLATALRTGMMEVAKARHAAEGRNEKADFVYNYLCGAEFKHHISGVVESFATMLSDLDSEERSLKAIWKKRRKQLERAFTGTAGLYGDLQGLMGTALPEIRQLEMPALEVGLVAEHPST